MSKEQFHIATSADVRQAMTKAYHAASKLADEGESVRVTIETQSRRSAQANALLWVRLGELADQATWHGIKLSPEEWKDLASAGLMKSKVIPNIDGTGFVIVGQRTSKMSVRQMNDLIELIHALGSDLGVRFSIDPREVV